MLTVLLTALVSARPPLAIFVQTHTSLPYLACLQYVTDNLDEPKIRDPVASYVIWC